MDITLIECNLETGRTHQIRVHLTHLGFPIIGDQVYGTGYKSKIKKLNSNFINQYRDFHHLYTHVLEDYALKICHFRKTRD